MHKTAILEHLLPERSPNADHALLTALANAEPHTAQLVVEVLISRRKAPGLIGLISLFHRLDEQSKGLVLAAVDQLGGCMREVTHSPSQQTRLNVIEIILSSRSFRNAYLLAHLLNERPANIRQEAGEAIYQLAQHLVPSRRCENPFSHPPPALPDGIERCLAADEQEQHDLEDVMSGIAAGAEDQRYLVDALEVALTSFPGHHHPRIIETALWFVDEVGPRLWPLVSPSGSRAHRLAADALSRANDPRLVPFVMNSLHHGSLRPRALQALATCDEPAFWTEWFRQAWRLVQPRVSRGLASARQFGCLQRREMDLLELPDEVRTAAPRVLAASGLPAEVRLEILKELERRSHDAMTRRAAAWRLAELNDNRAAALLRVMAGAHGRDKSRLESPGASGQSETGTIALLCLALRYPSEYPPSELLAALVPQSGVTRNAGVLPLDFDRYWTLFDQLDEHDRQRFGRAMLERTPPAAAMLARQLAHPDSIIRLRALRIIQELDLAGSLADQLYPLSQDPQPEVRSATLTVLGALKTPASRRIIRNALDDPVLRVQANAIEALEHWDDESVIHDLMPKLSSPDNRVQANAVKALLRFGVREAAQTLIQMLRAEEGARRISALWIIEHLKLAALLPRLVAMAECEKDPQIRERAMGLMQRLREVPPPLPRGAVPVAPRNPGSLEAPQPASVTAGLEPSGSPWRNAPSADRAGGAREGGT